MEPRDREYFDPGGALRCELGPVERTSLYGENEGSPESRLEFVLQQCDISLWLGLGYDRQGLKGSWRLFLRMEHPEYYWSDWKERYAHAG